MNLKKSLCMIVFTLVPLAVYGAMENSCVPNKTALDLNECHAINGDLSKPSELVPVEQQRSTCMLYNDTHWPVVVTFIKQQESQPQSLWIPAGEMQELPYLSMIERICTIEPQSALGLTGNCVNRAVGLTASCYEVSRSYLGSLFVRQPVNNVRQQGPAQPLTTSEYMSLPLPAEKQELFDVFSTIRKCVLCNDMSIKNEALCGIIHIVQKADDAGNQVLCTMAEVPGISNIDEYSLKSFKKQLEKMKDDAQKELAVAADCMAEADGYEKILKSKEITCPLAQVNVLHAFVSCLYDAISSNLSAQLCPAKRLQLFDAFDRSQEQKRAACQLFHHGMNALYRGDETVSDLIISVEALFEKVLQLQNQAQEKLQAIAVPYIQMIQCVYSENECEHVVDLVTHKLFQATRQCNIPSLQMLRDQEADQDILDELCAFASTMAKVDSKFIPVCEELKAYVEQCERTALEAVYCDSPALLLGMIRKCSLFSNHLERHRAQWLEVAQHDNKREMVTFLKCLNHTFLKQQDAPARLQKFVYSDPETFIARVEQQLQVMETVDIKTLSQDHFHALETLKEEVWCLGSRNSESLYDQMCGTYERSAAKARLTCRLLALDAKNVSEFLNIRPDATHEEYKKALALKWDALINDVRFQETLRQIGFIIRSKFAWENYRTYLMGPSHVAQLPCIAAQRCMDLCMRILDLMNKLRQSLDEEAQGAE